MLFSCIFYTSWFPLIILLYNPTCRMHLIQLSVKEFLFLHSIFYFFFCYLINISLTDSNHKSENISKARYVGKLGLRWNTTRGGKKCLFLSHVLNFTSFQVTNTFEGMSSRITHSTAVRHTHTDTLARRPRVNVRPI